jgi:[ribosomal protein S5]-alanine N-acetyltransferase
VIRTARLALRDLAPADLAPFLAWHLEPGYADFYGPGDAEPAHMREVFAKILGWTSESPRRNWQLGIEAGDLVGTIGIRTKDLPPGQAEFGLGLAPRCWGKGYATEASRAMLEFAFNHLAVREITGHAVTQNSRLEPLMKGLGFSASPPEPGPEWMRAKGWTRTLWTLSRK